MAGEFEIMKAIAGSSDANAQESLCETAGAEVLRHLVSRRSVSASALLEPGPDRAALDEMLTIAARVPDHKKLAPWRFVVLQDEARARFGTMLARICKENDPEASDVRLETERGRFLRAPTVVVVVSSTVSHPGAPEWEQILSAGAVCLNLLHAASAQGFGAQWITEWYAYDSKVRAGFGLQEHERIAGFVYIGTRKDKPAERERPDIAAITSFPEGPAN
jgi:nitroreductase